jgi:hypothetical protein
VPRPDVPDSTCGGADTSFAINDFARCESDLSTSSGEVAPASDFLAASWAYELNREGDGSTPLLRIHGVDHGSP